MSLIRCGALVVVFCVTSGLAKSSAAQESEAVADLNSRSDDLSIQAFKDNCNVAVKRFYIAMRDKSVDKLRDLIDPEYIEQHGLKSGFESEMIPVNNVYKIKASPDRKTLLCHLLKDGKQTGVVVLNVVQRESGLFIVPPTAPQGKSNRVTPWLLHANLDAS